MIPGFVTLGVLAVLFQAALVGGFGWYLLSRRPIADATTYARIVRILAVGTGLVVVGELAAFAALGSLRVVDVLSFRQALFVQDVGLAAAGVGYLLVVVGVVAHGRASGADATDS